MYSSGNKTQKYYMYKSVPHDGIGREELRTKEFVVSHLFLVALPFSGVVYRFS